jgi:DHA2 family multidrug resistance protein-like MFS transporter
MPTSLVSTDATDSTLSNGLTGRPLRLAAISIFIGMVCANLDMSIVQNALPGLSRELRIDSAESVWIVTLYMLVSLTLILPFAPLSDRVGYKRFYLIGFIVFIVASLACGLAGSFWLMQTGRLLQGVGSAAMMCSTTSLIRLVYPREMMARAIGFNSTVVAVSMAGAPSLSAFILTHLSWHWLFLINVPLGAFACVLGYRALPSNRVQLPDLVDRAALRAWSQVVISQDWLGVALNIAFFTLLLLGTEALGRVPTRGVALLACAALLGYLFVRRQAGSADPMLPFDLLADRNYGFTIATSFASFAAQGAAFVALPFYMQGTLGMTPAMTGLVLTAWPLSLAVAASSAGHMMRHIRISRLCGLGLCLLGAGMVALGCGLGRGSIPLLIILLGICGVGFGMFQTPNNYVIVASAPADRSGSVGGLRAATRTAGQLIGAALAGLMFLVAQAWQMLDGATLGLFLSAAMALWAAACSLSRRTPGELETADSRPTVETESAH